MRLPDSAAGISLRGLEKRFGEAVAVHHLDLDIGTGEFFSLLGPSGCGKTTTLRMIAGFERPDAGQIWLGKRDVTNLPANQRPVNMVFQQYALFPHLTVLDNVGFGLAVDGTPKRERLNRVMEMLEVVQLTKLAQRRPRELSGGQQQRVALARALVKRPQALLLDEPLGALDVKLRRQMQTELKRLQDLFRTTFVYVTHDQDEALAMSDRIAIMNAGLVEQIGTPEDIYLRPSSEFAAGFVGLMNLFEFRVDEANGPVLTMHVDPEHDVEIIANAHTPARGASLRVMIRPEDLRLETPGSFGIKRGLSGQVVGRAYGGATIQVRVKVPSLGMFVALVPHDSIYAAARPGTEVLLTWAESRARALG